MAYNLFDEEERILEQGAEVAKRIGTSDPEIAEEFKALTKSYKKLLKTTKKLVRISDKNEDKLNRLGKELAAKNALLEEQKQELIEAAQLREEVERITRHDLKNPLQNILAVPELLIMTLELEDYQRDMLKRVETAGYDMLNMINLSLDLFKMEQGTYQIQASEVNLLKVLRKIVGDQESIWSGKEMPVSIMLNGNPAVEEDTFPINGEGLLCYSMFSNLVRNALDASPEGETFTISLDNEARSITLHNHGAVPEEIRDRFFEKYTTSGKKRGTGLGTYSAKLIAEVHGGSIGFTTSEADGTAVTVTFPA